MWILFCAVVKIIKEIIYKEEQKNLTQDSYSRCKKETFYSAQHWEASSGLPCPGLDTGLKGRCRQISEYTGKQQK